MRRFHITIFTIIFCCLFWCSWDLSAADLGSVKIADKLQKVLNIPANAKVGVAVFDLNNGEGVYEFNSVKPLKPASVLKILTSNVALSQLSTAYKFSTEVWAENLNKDGFVNVLYVKGGGDPSFTTEDMWMLARKIKLHGIKKISALRLDDSYFSNAYRRQGQSAYQAGASALSLNFNSISFRVCPNRPGQKALITVDPWEYGVQTLGAIDTISRGAGQFGIDEVARIDNKHTGKMLYRLRGTFGAKRQCEYIYRTVDEPVYYFGVVLRKFLKLLGVWVDDDIRRGAVSARAKLLFSSHSKPLGQIVRDLNIYSNNFIAEQLLTVLGCSVASKKYDKKRCDKQRGIRKAEEYLRRLGYAKPEFEVVDGSGLDHTNRMSARILLHLLVEALKVEEYRPEFESSLPIAGISGTLKKRNFGSAPVLVRAKTGTLNGVSSLAGYLTSKRGNKFAFVVVQNNVRSKRDADKLENKLIKFLYNHD
ncbi:D-alanyl-D-alanine carboxypeptidase/D-alanyl-D-alanine-endopeptidase [Oligoflexia bacterium]|nr:D-alanyl-D-alanine carboxypeptidase/D-alanyl-D-alanine-endopeptidase [Oligoflexia bacterium]